MIIEQVHIKNYQSHKDTALDLVDGVNVIIGKSDSGKSAIIRAMKWIFENKPTGDAFRRHGSKETVGTLVFKNEIVGRVKSDNKKFGNSYVVCWDRKGHYQFDDEDLLTDFKDDEIEIFKSIKTGVPDEIKKFFNMDELNIQHQHDAPFLLSSTAGEVAKYLNQIVQLEVIDKSLSAIESRRRKINREIPTLQENLGKKQEYLKEFDVLNEIEEIIVHVEQLEEQSRDLETEHEELSELLDDYEDTEKRKKQLVFDREDLEKLKSIESKISELSKLENELEELKDDLANYQETLKAQQRWEKTKLELEKEYERIAPNVCPICGRKWDGKRKSL